MAASFCDLPTEVWLLIAHYLTKSQLSKLKSVNNFFLNCWMDLEWKQIHVDITARYSETVVRLLGRVDDPFVAVRVKQMSILLNSKKLASLSSSHMSFSTTLKTLHLLPNITSLDIELIKYSTFHVTTLIRTIISSGVARTLQKLVLSGHLGEFASLGESAHKTPFENLTELNLTESSPNSDYNPNTQTNSFLEALLRSLAPNLQILHIYSHWSALKPSPLFDALLLPLPQYDTPGVFFPNLKSLFVSFNSTTSFRSFSRSLHYFLLSHNNLQHLYLDIQYLWRNFNDEECLGERLADLLNCDQYPSFQSLTIYPTTSQAGLSAVLTLIRRNARTLSSLKILDRYLTFEEAKQVVDALTASQVQVQVSTMTAMMTTPTTEQEPKKLKSLSMNITRLSVSFLDFLAHNFPQLDSLSLMVNEIIGSDQVCFPHSFISTRLKYTSYSIRFTISSTTDGTTPTSHVPKKTYCTPGNCTSSRFGGTGLTKSTRSARWRMLYRLYLVRWRMTITERHLHIRHTSPSNKTIRWKKRTTGTCGTLILTSATQAVSSIVV